MTMPKIPPANGSIIANFEKPAIIHSATKMKNPNIAPRENGCMS